MRLAIYSTLRTHPWGAPDVLWTRAALSALRAGHEVFAVVRRQIIDHPEIVALHTAGARIHLVPEVPGGGRLNRIATTARNLRTGARGTLAALGAFRPDRLIINQGGFYDFAFEHDLFALIAELGCSYLLLAHSNRESDALDEQVRVLAIQRINAAQRVLAISRHVLELAERQLLAHIGNGGVFQNPVDLGVSLPLPWPTASTPAFAVVSRLDAHNKGIDLLFGALRVAPGRNEAWRLNVYGEGRDRAYLQALAQWEGIADRVTFHGHVTDKAQIWSRNHLLLLPSRWEGCSYAMVEALLCGRPVLRTNFGGVAEWLRDGVNGFLCPAPEQTFLAATLERAWRCRDEWQVMGEAAHRHAAAQRDPAPVQTLLSLVEGLTPGAR